MKRQKFCSVMTIISSFIDFLTTSIFIPFLADFYGAKLKNPQKVPKYIVFKENVFSKSCSKFKIATFMYSSFFRLRQCLLRYSRCNFWTLGPKKCGKTSKFGKIPFLTFP